VQKYNKNTKIKGILILLLAGFDIYSVVRSNCTRKSEFPCSSRRFPRERTWDESHKPDIETQRPSGHWYPWTAFLRAETPHNTFLFNSIPWDFICIALNHKYSIKRGVTGQIILGQQWLIDRYNKAPMRVFPDSSTGTRRGQLGCGVIPASDFRAWMERTV